MIEKDHLGDWSPEKDSTGNSKVGPTLWSKLHKNDKTCKSLSEFRNRMRNKDLTSLIDDRCKACLLCDS